MVGEVWLVEGSEFQLSEGKGFYRRRKPAEKHLGFSPEPVTHTVQLQILQVQMEDNFQNWLWYKLPSHFRHLVC